MSKDIVVNVDDTETRVAVLEDDTLVELFIERTSNRRIVGNIYKGKVVNVLPGMQSAFVDIGLERNAFLYVDDALASELINGEDHDEAMEELGTPSIKDVVKVGQDILVQVTKEPIGSKGARVITNITLPGRYVVLMPMVNYIGVSRRISSDKERDRLKRRAKSIRPKGMGLIIRTVAEGKSEKELAHDIRFLTKVWRRIKDTSRKCKSPTLLYEDHDLLYRVVRDIFTPDVDRFYIDSKAKYEEVLSLLNIIGSNLKKKAVLYRKNAPIFDFFGIESQIDNALKRKVWLSCGGYLIIDQTEALTSIDVNTGKYIGTTNLADTVLKTNLDAAKEIARQLRLRNIGGIIIIDFIDMASQKDEHKVLEVFEREIKKDKTKTHILGFTRLGLLEVTRKKTKEGLDDILQRPCSHCDGKGKVLSEETAAIKAEREIKRLARQAEAEAMLVEVYPSVAALLIGCGGSNLRKIEEDTGMYVYIKGSAELRTDTMKVVHVGARHEVEEKALPVTEGQVIEVKIEEVHVSNRDNGIARIEGYVIDVDSGGKYVGKKTKIQVNKVFRTYAKAKLI